MKYSFSTIQRYGLLSLTASIAAVVIMCSPPPVHRQSEPLPESTIDTISVPDAALIQQESAALIAQLQYPDSSKVNLKKNRQKLFDLFISCNNPTRPYIQAIALAESLVTMDISFQERVLYSNWKSILLGYLQIQSQRDSLTALIEKSNESTKEIKSLQRRQLKQIDSLSVVVGLQKATIAKLQELDMRLEQQRSKTP